MPPGIEVVVTSGIEVVVTSGIEVTVDVSVVDVSVDVLEVPAAIATPATNSSATTTAPTANPRRHIVRLASWLASQQHATGRVIASSPFG
jgi:hypothetical protein